MPIFVSMSKAEQADFPLTQATWPRTNVSKKSTQKAELFPFPSSQPRARVVATQKAKVQSARDRKRADEVGGHFVVLISVFDITHAADACLGRWHCRLGRGT
jgi:hypothetical protein